MLTKKMMESGWFRESRAEERTTDCLGVAKVAESAAGDGVEPELVRLATLVDAVGDDADGLALSVRDLACVQCVYNSWAPVIVGRRN
jgi:hypothetical protein